MVLTRQIHPKSVARHRQHKRFNGCIITLLSLLPQVLWAQIDNFNEPNLQHLSQQIQAKRLNVVQFGDSHTAADSMTDALRNSLQSRLGDGGLGWAMPMYFNGQRMARIGYDNMGWQGVSSRSNAPDNFPLGGFFARPTQAGAQLTLKPKRSAEALQSVTLRIRQNRGDEALVLRDARGSVQQLRAAITDGTWQTLNFQVQLPFTLSAGNSTGTAIGGWWLRNRSGQGAVVSALGINGAELSMWQRWHAQWSNELAQIQPDVVILAYGTNEAFNPRLDLYALSQDYTQRIKQIRAAAPQSVILLLAAPESLSSKAGDCGERPKHLDVVQQLQRQIASQNHTLFWDWQQAMGGACSMKRWMAQGLAAPDAIHFSAAGYNRLGQQLALDVLALASGNRDVVGQAGQPNLSSDASTAAFRAAPQVTSQLTSQATSKSFSQAAAKTTTTTQALKPLRVSRDTPLPSLQSGAGRNRQNSGFAQICTEEGNCQILQP